LLDGKPAAKEYTFRINDLHRSNVAETERWPISTTVLGAGH
jgi:hypothetical protein